MPGLLRTRKIITPLSIITEDLRISPISFQFEGFEGYNLDTTSGRSL